MNEKGSVLTNVNGPLFFLFAPQAVFNTDNHVRADASIIVDKMEVKSHLTLQHSSVFKDPSFLPFGYTSSPQITIEQEIWSQRLP